MTTALQLMRIRPTKFFSICRKSLWGNDLGRPRRPPPILSPYVATTYVNSAEQIPCQKKIRNIPRIIVEQGLTLTMYIV
jgi:hypothetical protein